MISAGLILGQLVTFAPSGYVGVLSVGDRTETRVRGTPGGGESTAVDVETTPDVLLALNGRRSDLFLAYAPRFAYLDIAGPAADPTAGKGEAIVHTARIGAGWAASPRLRLTVGATGFYGKQISAGLLAPQTLGPASPLQPSAFVAASTTISTAGYRADLGAAYRLSSRWSLNTDVAYIGGKGLDEASRAFLPAYQGPSATVGVSHDLTRHEQLLTRATASTVSGIAGSRYSNASLMEVWSKAWAEHTSSTIGAGVSVFVVRRPGETESHPSPFPIGDASVTHVIPLRTQETLALSAAARTAVLFDPILQTATPQAAAALIAKWAYARVGLTTSIDAITTLPGPAALPPSRQLIGMLVAWYAPARAVRLETGVRAFLQHLSPTPLLPDPPNTPQWVAFVAITAEAPILDF